MADLNLVDVVKGQFGPRLIAILADLTGQSAEQAQTSMNVAVPTILGALAKAASPERADTLSNLVARQDAALLDRLAYELGGTRQLALVAQGRAQLDTAIGHQQVIGLTGALDSATAAGGQAIGSLIGLVTPVVMAVLKREQAANATDVDPATMLLSQHPNVLAAIGPVGARSLSAAGVIDLAVSAEPAPATATTTTTPATAKRDTGRSRTPPPGGMPFPPVPADAPPPAGAAPPPEGSWILAGLIVLMILATIWIAWHVLLPKYGIAT